MRRDEVAACVLCQEAYCRTCRVKVARSSLKNQTVEDDNFDKEVGKAMERVRVKQTQCMAPSYGTEISRAGEMAV